LVHHALVSVVDFSNQDVQKQDCVDETVQEPEGPYSIYVILNQFSMHPCLLLHVSLPLDESSVIVIDWGSEIANTVPQSLEENGTKGM